MPNPILFLIAFAEITNPIGIIIVAGVGLAVNILGLFMFHGTFRFCCHLLSSLVRERLCADFVSIVKRVFCVYVLLYTVRVSNVCVFVFV